MESQLQFGRGREPRSPLLLEFAHLQAVDRLQFGLGGSTISSDGNGGLVARGKLNVDNDGVNGGNITAAGNMFAQNFIQTSDRNAKENFTPLDCQKVLARVVSLPISQWNFKTDANTRHIGPMAQDFYAAFNVGMDEKHIATVDEGGVALAAIQGLNEKLKEKDTRIEAMEKRLADLEELIKPPTHN